MEHGIKLIDFETVDQMVQVHGTCASNAKIRTKNRFLILVP